MSGQNYHKIGSFLPILGQQPRFLQLYVHDTANEIQNRISAIGNIERHVDVDTEIVEQLRLLLDANNEIVKAFRMVRDKSLDLPDVGVRLRLIANRSISSSVYTAPTATEIAALIVGDLGESHYGRDIIVEHRSEGLMRINDLHPLFMSMQYPLLFPYGDDGYHLAIPYVLSPMKEAIEPGFLTMREYYAYVIQQCCVNSNTLLRGGKLFQQYLVDAYATVEETRLRYIRDNQKSWRSEMYKNIWDAMSRDDMEAYGIGKRIVLPASFTGGPRYMFQNYQDAMAICR